MSANLIQFHRIVQCHARLSRLGRIITLEETAKLWISRYAAAWRKHHDRNLGRAA